MSEAKEKDDLADFMRRELSQPFGFHDKPLPPLGPVGLTIHVVLYVGVIVGFVVYYIACSL